MQLISTVTVGASASQIVFSNIPQTFTDLCLVLSMRTARTVVLEDALFWFNSFNTGTYTNRYIYGSGSATTSASNSIVYGWAGWANGASATTSTFGNSEIYIPNYTRATSKSFSSTSVNENNATEAYQMLVAGQWNLTEAITSISITGASALPGQYSSASLYGITNGSGGATVS